MKRYVPDTRKFTDFNSVEELARAIEVDRANRFWKQRKKRDNMNIKWLSALRIIIPVSCGMFTGFYSDFLNIALWEGLILGLTGYVCSWAASKLDV